MLKNSIAKSEVEIKRFAAKAQSMLELILPETLAGADWQTSQLKKSTRPKDT